MDRRTAQLIDTLRHPGAVFVFNLLTKGPLTEERLLASVPDTSQSTGNRRLHALDELGLLTRAPGPRQYKDRPWRLAVIEATDAFLGAAMELSHAIARNDEMARDRAQTELREGRGRRRGLSSIDGKGLVGEGN